MAISSVTQPHEKSDSVSVTAGELSTSAGREVPFAIFWRSRPSTAIFEIESFPVSRVGHLLVGGDDFGYRIRERFESFLLPPPKPIVDLDSAASLLLHNSATMLGLSFGARCMAAWRYLTEWGTDGAATARRLDPLAPSAASAAALEVVVAKRMELRITTNSAAEHFGCDVEDVRREVRHIAAMVREREDVGW
jgi:hypothetical protein